VRSISWSSTFFLSLCVGAGLLSNLNEEVQGLTALDPMETRPSLARLGVQLRNF